MLCAEINGVDVSAEIFFQRIVIVTETLLEEFWSQRLSITLSKKFEESLAMVRRASEEAHVCKRERLDGEGIVYGIEKIRRVITSGKKPFQRDERAMTKKMPEFIPDSGDTNHVIGLETKLGDKMRGDLEFEVVNFDGAKLG